MRNTTSKMEEKTITKTAMITTIIGLLLLFFLSEENGSTVTKTLDDSSPQETAIVEGLVTKVVHKNTAYFLDVDATRREKMNIIVFPSEELYLKEGNIISVQGIVQEYNGEKEVIASKIIVKGEIKQGNETDS